MISLRNRKNRLNVQQKNKINEIREALNNNDIYTLRNLSRTEGGFVTSELRKLCWPFLLHVDVSNIRISENKTDITSDLSDEINNENLNSDVNENQDTIKESSENIDNQNNITEELDKNINETIQTIVVPENEIEEEIINQTNINEKSNNNITNEENNNDSNNIEKIDSTQQNEKTDTEVNNDKNNNIQNEQKENNESIEQTESNEKKIESPVVDKPDESIVEETIKKDEQNEKTDTEENNESINQTESNEEKIESQVVDKPEESIVEEIIKTDEQKESNNSEITNNEILLNRDIPNNNVNDEIKNEDEVVKEKENNPEIKKEVGEEKEIEIKKEDETEEKEEKKEEGENKSENVVEKEENKVDDENENNDKKKSNNEFQENFDNNKDDLNSETLKDENMENIENITQENIIIASQSSNEDTYLEKESLNKKDNLSEKSDNEDYTKNNHTDDEGDDVLFKGEIDINAGEVHDNYFKDYGENKGIFNNSNNNSNCNSGEELNKDNNNNNNNNNEELNQTHETENNGSASKKCVAKDIILESDDDPERMDKLKQIENESKYRDKRQIMLDVNRAFVHFPKGLKAKEKTIKQIELSNVILYSLKDHSYLHYYQGYHDICSLLLLVLGEDIAKPCAEILALYWLREYMKETLEPTLEVMSLLYPILKYADPKIYKLVYNNMIPPYFSISWVITWCIHDLRDTSEMERIFDFFISNNPIMPIYFAAAVILTQKEKLYQRFPQILEDNNKNREDETDPETAMPNFSVVHQFLTNLLPIATSQTKDVTVDSAVELAWSLYEQYPLKFLMKKESIKLNSLCCVKRYFEDCEKVLPNLPFNKEEIIKLLKEEEKLNLEMALATPTSKNDHIKKMQEKANIIGKYLSQHITLWTIATTLILVTAIILTHEFSKSYYI